MAHLLLPMSMISLLSIGAIFGFFYAWVCSTMWGLDAADPRTAISAMQAMNASVRNAVFFPAFFLTPAFLALTAFFAIRQGHKRAANLFISSAGIYVIGVFLVTAVVNVPMNNALAGVYVPTASDAARPIWESYSQPWQFWNTLRAAVSGVALLLTGLALVSIKTVKA